ncbi:hypothetical protein APW31_09420 [Staphylococcus aureus]|nr:hypothetical protein APW31_09420 [Staphylococcus aureus]
MTVTIYDVAREARVSMATVSRVVNGNQNVKAETKNKVNEAQQGRQVTGKWSWLAPPLSPTLTSNYHHGYDNTVKDPNFFYKKKESNANQCPFHH